MLIVDCCDKQHLLLVLNVDCRVYRDPLPQPHSQPCRLLRPNIWRIQEWVCSQRYLQKHRHKKHFLLLQGKDGLALKKCTKSLLKRCTGWKSPWLLGIGPSMLATMTGWRWGGDSILFLIVHSESTPPHYSDQVTEGKAYRLRIGQFLARYSTLGDALSPDPCPRWQTGHTRAANMSFSAKWDQRPEHDELYMLLRDLDQDENNTTHCANATFINPGANRWG